VRRSRTVRHEGDGRAGSKIGVLCRPEYPLVKPELGPLVWLALACTAVAAAPTNLFVAPGGNDGGPGSAAQPFATHPACDAGRA